MNHRIPLSMLTLASSKIGRVLRGSKYDARETIAVRDLSDSEIRAFRDVIERCEPKIALGDAAVEIPVVCVDARGVAVSMRVELHAAKRNAGAMFARRKAVISEIVRYVHGPEAADSPSPDPVKAYLAKASGSDALVIFHPDAVDHLPVNLLERHPDVAGALALEIVLADKYGPGKSRVLVSASKLEFLYPDIRFHHQACDVVVGHSFLDAPHHPTTTAPGKRARSPETTPPSSPTKASACPNAPKKPKRDALVSALLRALEEATADIA